jgi:SNF2 family DNA or RNA helicase
VLAVAEQADAMETDEREGLKTWEASRRSSCLPVLTECLTASCFYRVVTLASWKSRLPEKNRVHYSYQGMGCFGGSASRYLSLTMNSRLEGYLMKYAPHDYQTYATRYIEEHPISAVLLDMGLGKTSITLTALNDLLFDSFEAHRILVIAPLRVARDTWTAEVEKWDHLADLQCSVAVGSVSERKAALCRRADIYIINRENVQWLIEDSKLPFNYDTVVVDELSSFKNYQAKRFRALMKVRPSVKRIIGLTGTPSSNGLMDLWAEFRLLDMGARLGRFISHYRLEYFQPDKRNGQVIFSYKPLPGAEQRIYDKISDITISMRSTDHLKMPELVSSEYTVRLSDEERERYDELKQDLVLQLPDGEITAANAAALTGKLCQMANGAIYTDDGGTIPFTTESWTHWRTSSKPLVENRFGGVLVQA